MAEDKRDEGTQRSASPPSGKDQTGDPGRTPGTAEGDRETVEEDLENKEDK